jgi:hypothetical protein
MLNYELIAGNTPEELENRVRDAIEFGRGIPCGGVSTTIVPVPQKISETQVTYKFQPVYAQALVSRDLLASISADAVRQAEVAKRMMTLKKPLKRRRKKK